MGQELPPGGFTAWFWRRPFLLTHGDIASCLPAGATGPSWLAMAPTLSRGNQTFWHNETEFYRPCYVRLWYNL
jgi:hypothetical protein